MEGSGRATTYTQNDDEQEVDVCNVVELEPQVLRDEAEGRVFCGSYLVAGILCDGMAFVVALGLRQGHVEVDSPACVMLFFGHVGIAV